MINLTFASFKNQRDIAQIKLNIAKKHDLPTASFKTLTDLKDRTVLKVLENQENTQQQPQLPQNKKNMVKVEKSNKKYQPKLFKSPKHKNW